MIKNVKVIIVAYKSMKIEIKINAYFFLNASQLFITLFFEHKNDCPSLDVSHFCILFT